MNTLLVTYDLHSPIQKYPDLYAALKSYPAWIRVAQSSWAIHTSKDPGQVVEALLHILDENDTLFVTPINSWAGQLPLRVLNWLARLDLLEYAIPIH